MECLVGTWVLGGFQNPSSGVRTPARPLHNGVSEQGVSIGAHCLIFNSALTTYSVNTLPAFTSVRHLLLILLLLQVAEVLVKRCLDEAVFLVKLVLWLLATRLGTLLLCRSLSLSRGFPFINKFSEMTVEKREEALKRWSREKTISYLRVAFVVFKILCFFVFYSTVNFDFWPVISSFDFFFFGLIAIACFTCLIFNYTLFQRKWARTNMKYSLSLTLVSTRLAKLHKFCSQLVDLFHSLAQR